MIFHHCLWGFWLWSMAQPIGKGNNVTGENSDVKKTLLTKTRKTILPKTTDLGLFCFFNMSFYTRRKKRSKNTHLNVYFIRLYLFVLVDLDYIHILKDNYRTISFSPAQNQTLQQHLHTPNHLYCEGLFKYNLPDFCSSTLMSTKWNKHFLNLALSNIQISVLEMQIREYLIAYLNIFQKSCHIKQLS